MSSFRLALLLTGFLAGTSASAISKSDLFRDFNAAQQKAIDKQGFVIVPAQHAQFSEAYSDTTPNFITTDAMLHTYHLVDDHRHD